MCSVALALEEWRSDMNKFSRERVNGFLHTDGARMVNGNGETIVLRGWGAGNWMNPEGFMIGGVPLFNEGGSFEDFALPRRFERGRTMESTLRELCGTAYAKEFAWRWYREYLQEEDIRLILDEMQCGMGRTGEMFAWQRYGVKPDIMTTAKALGCGVPVGAFLMTEKAGTASLTSGDHGTTYGGNPLAAAAINIVLDLLEENHIIDNVKETGAYLAMRLDELAARYDCISERRGLGLMQGLVFKNPVGSVITRALEKGLIMINAGADIIRFVQPLVITKEHVDEMIGILEESIEER